MQRDKGLLLDMKRAATLIMQFAERMSFDEFRSDLKTQSAVIHHYRGVDLREIWKATEQEIPRLLAFLEEHHPEL